MTELEKLDISLLLLAIEEFRAANASYFAGSLDEFGAKAEEREKSRRDAAHNLALRVMRASELLSRTGESDETVPEKLSA